MAKKRFWWTMGIGAGVLVVAIGLIPLLYHLFNLRANEGFQNATAALMFITAAAVAIERAVELGWTFVGGVSKLGSYWPLKTIADRVDALTSELDDALEPLQKQLADAAAGDEDQFNEVTKEIARLKESFDEIKKLTPSNQKVQLLAAAARKNVNYLKSRFEGQLGGLDLKAAADSAKVVIGGLDDFLATFKDNPGRRMISLYAGSVLGLIVAGVFRLDIFQAVLETPAEQFGPWRIAATGLILGLGSNPTHEVVRALQEYKKNRKAFNIATPSV